MDTKLFVLFYPVNLLRFFKEFIFTGVILVSIFIEMTSRQRKINTAERYLNRKLDMKMEYRD